VGGRWRIVRGGTFSWSDPPLNSQWMTDSVNGLVVGDFDGDGIADVARSSDNGSQFSPGGTGPWQRLAPPQNQIPIDVSGAAAVGRFGLGNNLVVLDWKGRKLFSMSHLGGGDVSNEADMR